MNPEGPFRETTPREPFDPTKHEITKHEEGILAGKNTYVRKTAIESDKEATEKAEKRNLVFNWVDKLLGKKRETYNDVLVEEALKERINADIVIDQPDFLNEVVFTYKNHNIHITKYNTKQHSVLVDGLKVSDKQAELLYKHFFPLLSQINKNNKRTKTIDARLAKKQAEILAMQEDKRRHEKLEPTVNELLGINMSALNEADEPKQLNPKKEE